MRPWENCHALYFTITSYRDTIKVDPDPVVWPVAVVATAARHF
ncbi:hypothetical protein [Parapedobacter koreensis]|nr:hypothetical protein [Parapedobacter koreensis]